MDCEIRSRFILIIINFELFLRIKVDIKRTRFEHVRRVGGRPY